MTLAKKIKGKKRHFLVDTQGLLLLALVHSAGMQDRDGGILYPDSVRIRRPPLPNVLVRILRVL
jgi:hypothetical protein